MGDGHDPSVLSLEGIEPTCDPLKQSNHGFTPMWRGIAPTGPRGDLFGFSFLYIGERAADPATEINILQRGIDHRLKLQRCRSLSGPQRRAGPCGI
jgi:hypothetical protein